MIVFWRALEEAWFWFWLFMIVRHTITITAYFWNVDAEWPAFSFGVIIAGLFYIVCDRLDRLVEEYRSGKFAKDETKST